MPRRQSDRPGDGESGLVQRVRERLASFGLSLPIRVVSAFSGGTDSLALTTILSRLARQGQVHVTAVHVDHGLRPESAADVVLVAALADRLGVRLRVATLEPGIREWHPGVGIEEAARRERYLALAQIARDEGADAIALAHHSSDQAESVLLHLLRGAGIQGMGGMAEWSRRRIPWWDDTASSSEPIALWRPLLNESKASLSRYVADLGFVPVDDPSNQSMEFLRNRIRRELVPRLDDLSPGATESIGRFVALAAADDDFLGTLASAALREVTDPSNRISTASLQALHPAMRRRVVRSWIESIVPGGVEIGFDRIEAVRRLANQRRGNKTIQLGAGWVVRSSDGYLECTARPG